MTLHEVYFDNLRTHQIGETDGVSGDVAHDIGLLTSADEAALLAEATQTYGAGTEVPSGKGDDGVPHVTHDIGLTMPPAETDATPALGASPRSEFTRTEPLPINKHVQRGRASVRAFTDSASVDRPQEALGPYQPLDPTTVLTNQKWLAAIRAQHTADTSPKRAATPTYEPFLPPLSQGDPAGVPPRELITLARDTAIDTGVSHKLIRDTTGTWRIVPV